MQNILAMIGKFLTNEGRFIIGFVVIIFIVYVWETISNSEDFLRWVIRIQPKNADADLRLGNHLKGDEPEEAEKEIRQAITLNPRLRDAYYSLYSFLIDNKNRFKDAEHIVNQMLKVIPDDGITYIYQGYLLFLQDDCLDAEKAFRKAISMLPNSSFAQVHFGNFLFTQKRFNEAETAYRKAVELNPFDADAYLKLRLFIASS